MKREEYEKRREEYEKIEREQQEKIRKLIKKRFHDDNVKVIFLPSDVSCPPLVGFLKCNLETTDHVGYIIVPEGVQIPFIARVYPDNTVYVFLNTQKDFYLTFFVGNLEKE